ncbi:hypothetical protein EV424DRAFT_1341501 [Suillus variegatus]|nr:hypothetical protein EV424DRAFT_1341501 [Suillus variegatus]
MAIDPKQTQDLGKGFEIILSQIKGDPSLSEIMLYLTFEVSNKALDDAATQVQQIVAQAVEWKNGHTGHLRMAGKKSHLCAPLRRKRSRESSQNEQLSGSMPSATCPPVSTHTSNQRKPWFEQPWLLERFAVIVRIIPGVIHPAMPPTRHMHPLPSHTQHMDIDVPADTMVKDLQAMTLEVEQDSVSVLKSHQEIYNTIHDLHNQVIKLRAQNAAATESLEALNVRVTTQDVEMRSIETLHTDVAVL